MAYSKYRALDCCPLSVSTLSGIPSEYTSCTKNASVTDSEIFFFSSTTCAILKNLSITMGKCSKPSMDLGNGPSRSMAIYERSSVSRNTRSLRGARYHVHLVSVHDMQDATYSWTLPAVCVQEYNRRSKLYMREDPG